MGSKLGALQGFDITKNTEEEKGMREDAETLIEANQWEENRFRRDQKNQLVIDKAFWETLSNCTKVQIRKVQNYKSTAEPNREPKIGPEEERIMECDTCKKKFSNKANLANHKWAAHGKTVGVRQLVVPIVGTKEYKCFICKGTFKQKASAANHVQNIGMKGKNENETLEVIRAFQFSQLFEA